MTAPAVEALVFDVFGTVVDWRSGVIRAGKQIETPNEATVDWAAFADAWREEYEPALNQVRQGDRPWQHLDVLHRESLELLLEKFGIDGLSEDEIAHLNRVWHRLGPWPDVIPGLRRLTPHYVIAPLSNGHVRLLTNMARRAGIPWDLILSAELAGQYKPDIEVYLTAVDLLDCDPAEVMMVAAHEQDLDASREAGLQTAYIHRPLEWGPDQADADSRPADDAYDIVADDFLELADCLNTPPLIR